LSIARCSESQSTESCDRLRVTAGVSTHFPQCLWMHRSELAFRQCRFCHIQPSSTRHAECGFPRSGLHRHASLPRLLPGRDKAVALQHSSLVLISYEISSHTAYLRRTLSPYRAGIAGRNPTRLQAAPALHPCSCPLLLSDLGEVFASKSSTLNFGHLGWLFARCATWRTLSP
jgi:hypothetical protein